MIRKFVDRRCLAAALIASATAPSPVQAGQTVYEYDLRGRLVRVNQTAGSNNYDARYTYDKADNRLSYAVTLTSGTITNPAGGFVVVPLNGFKVIPLGQ